MMAGLTEEEVRFLLQALEQLPVRGREAVKLLLDISGKLEAVLKDEGKAPGGKGNRGT
jgi:hypothetical protein